MLCTKFCWLFFLFFVNSSHWLPSEQNRSFQIKTRIRVPFVCVFFGCFICLFYSCYLWYPKDSVLHSSGKLLWKQVKQILLWSILRNNNIFSSCKFSSAQSLSFDFKAFFASNAFLCFRVCFFFFSSLHDYPIITVIQYMQIHGDLFLTTPRILKSEKSLECFTVFASFLVDFASSYPATF